MAQPASNPKIEELRFRLKTDPKSRIFYPLGEELRKVSAFTEAEQVLRTGLANHPTYLSAWVSLGRVLRELGNNQEASESLTRALQLDPGNVAPARTSPTRISRSARKSKRSRSTSSCTRCCPRTKSSKESSSGSSASCIRPLLRRSSRLPFPNRRRNSRLLSNRRRCSMRRRGRWNRNPPSCRA